MIAVGAPVAPVDLVAAVRRQRAGIRAVEAIRWGSPGSLTVSVHGAHPGAGGSTVAVALAEFSRTATSAT
jgi:hypothetical protein